MTVESDLSTASNLLDRNPAQDNSIIRPRSRDALRRKPRPVLWQLHVRQSVIFAAAAAIDTDTTASRMHDRFKPSQRPVMTMRT